MFRLTRSRIFWLGFSSLLVLAALMAALAWTRGASAQGRTLPTRPAVTDDGPPPVAQTEPELPNFDAFHSSAAAKTRLARAARTPQFEGGHMVQTEALLDVPTMLWTAEGMRANANVPVRLRFSRTRLEETARQHLQRHSERYRLSGKDVNDVTVSQVHDTGRGAVIVKFKQVFNGIEVFREQLAVVMNRQLELVALTGYVTGADALDASSLKFALPPSKAIAVALSELSGTPVEAAALRADVAMNRARRDTPYEYFQAAPNVPLKAKPLQPVRSKKVIFHVVGQLVPAYYLEVELADPIHNTESRYYAYVISALDGQLLYRKNLAAHQSNSYRVWADSASKFPADAPTQDFTPHPTGVPDGFIPAFSAPSLITLQNFPFSFNDPWLPAGATETAGNNVDAYADLNSPDGLTAGDFRATITAPGVFDRVYDTTQEPNASQDQRMAAITQLFYVTNFLHDWFYDHGFDEASGNAQQDNFGRGGLGGDRMKAEAQDFSGLNNANMNTPADGAPPRMQMYLWNGPSSSSLTVNAGPLMGSYAHGTASFGPLNFTTTADLVVVDDGSTAVISGGTGTTDDGCQAIQNNVAGKIAVIRRGACTFKLKALNAQNAGAVGVIITNNVVSAVPPGLGDDAGITTPITIGTVSVTLDTGNALRAELASPATVNVTMTRTTGVRRDSALDNQIIAHEWGHYIHHRLTNTGNNQGRAMSEGWGDFTALLLTVREGDNYDGVFAAAAYATSATPNSYYFGIRRYPYSTDMSKNPLTFKHIENGVPLPVGPPVFPNGNPNAQVHNSGEIWATALWECYAALLKDNTRLTFAQAQQRMLSYVVAGYKLTPPDATFTEGRDALLLAAYINDPADFQLFTQAFAKRGLGLKAVSPARNSTDHSGVVEDFNSGGSLSYVSAVLDDSVKTCDSDGVLDNGEIGKLTVTLRNNGWTTLSNTTATISSPTPGVTFPSGATINFPSSNFNDTPSGSVNVQVTGLAGIQGLSFNISYNDPGMAMPGPVMASYEVRANTDEVPNSSKTDDVESNVPVWTVGHDAMVGDLADWARVQSNATNYFWHGPDVGGRSDHYLISPALQVSSTGDFTMTFAHRFDFESDATTDWDGGVIELSTDNGANWNDVGSLIGGADGYNGTITEPGANNPLIGRNVFSGQNANYPNFQTVTLNLGTTYAGQTVKIRFRVGTDEAAGANGWDLDNIAFSGIENTPFAQVVAETTYCCPTITVTNPATTTGMLGVFFSQSFSQTGGVGTITFSTASILPNGLTLSPGGVLSGTPTQLGTFPLTVKATDSNGCMGTQLYTLNISCSTLTLAGLSGGTAGTPYSQSVAASPAGTYSYAVTAGALPAGLQLDLSTGALSGTPTVAGSYSFTVTATNVALPACTGSQAYTVVIACPTITLNPASLPSATVNTPYPPTLAAAPAGTTYSFAVTNGTLPPGLTLNANGSFSGAPTQSGTFNFRVTATGFGNCTGFRDYQLTVACPTITLAPASLPGGTVGMAYSQSVSASPAGTFSYSVTSGALPTGLTLNPATGALTGTPAAAGTYLFTIAASVGGCSGSQNYSLTIICSALTLTPTSLPPAQAGNSYQQTVAAPGATNYSVQTGTLPPGLSLNGASGALTGTATVPGTYSFTLLATAAGGCSGTQAYTLVVTCPSIVVNPASLPGGTAGTAYNQSLGATPAGNYSYARTSGSLPPGLSLSAAGLLSGTPTTQGSYTFTVTATGFGTCAGSRSYTVTVTASCTTITLPALPATGKVGVNYYGNLAATTPSGSYTFSLESGTLPPGLVLDNLFAALVGKPTAAGAFNFTLKATRSNGCTGMRVYSVTISSAAALAQWADYDGDGRADLTLWSGTSGRWQILRSSDQQPQTPLWGVAGDVSLLGDYDGDGRTDLAVFRPANGAWYVQRSGDGTALVQTWGVAGDVPVPGDYDGDGKTDLAVWRPNDGNWYIQQSSTGSYAIHTWGAGGAPSLDVPVPGDYDGDGRTDLAVFRRSAGQWLLQRSRDGQALVKLFGLGTDVPVPGDYDGDGQTDLAVWRGATGQWFVWQSADGSYRMSEWGAGAAPDYAAPGDYDGDGKADTAVWRASTGVWAIKRSSDGTEVLQPHGQRSDVPILFKRN